MIGLWREIEYTQEDEYNGLVTHIHFASEVLIVDREQEFPWRLLDVWEWGEEREYEDLMRELKD